MVGERIREARLAQNRSLADVAEKAQISVATLSRIENDKQSVDLALFVALARVLDTTPNELLGDHAGNGRGDHGDPLARRIASLAPKERADLWRELAAGRRTRRAKVRLDAQQISQQIDELLAQMDFLREELESVRKRVKRR